MAVVAPFAGAWIEILDFFKYCARAVVRVRWNSEDAWGHIFIAEQVNGKTIFVDMQSGEINVEHYFDDVIHGETSFMRVDKENGDIKAFTIPPISNLEKLKKAKVLEII